MKYIPKITDRPRSCDICETTIDRNNYFLHVLHDGKVYDIHDNDICIEKLKVLLGLCKPNYLSSRPMDNWRMW